MFSPSQTDKRFVEVIDYLIDNKRHHNLFDTQENFLLKIGILPTLWPHIRKFNRLIAKKRIANVLKKLEIDFFVNPDYITKGILPRFTNENLVREIETPIYTKMQNQITTLQRVKELEELLKQKDTVIKQQQEIIEMYKGLERMGKLV